MEDQVEVELRTQALTLKEQAVALRVTDAPSFLAAGEMGKAMKELRGKVETYFRPLKEAAHRAHKAITAKEAEELKPIDEALTVLRGAMNTFTREQERQRQEAEAKLRREAEAKAEAERKALLAEAAVSETIGAPERAEEFFQRAVAVEAAPVVVAPVVAKTVKTSAGNVTHVKDIQITVADLRPFLVALLAEEDFPLGMIDVKPSALKAWAKFRGLTTYPGLTITETTAVRF